MVVSASESSHIPLQRFADLVIISDTPKGRGVFSTKPIPARTVIDVCPVLILGLEENKEHIEKTSLYHYTYNWPVTDKTGNKRIGQAVVFGLGSMFNHSSENQNVGWERDTTRQIVTYRALRDIPVGEELCISYGGRLTFKDSDSPATSAPVEEDVNLLNGIQLD